MRKSLFFLSIILAFAILIASCEYFRMMSYDEWIEFKTGDQEPIPVFPPNTIFVAATLDTSGDTTADGSMARPYHYIFDAFEQASSMAMSSITPGPIVVQSGTFTEGFMHM